MFYVISQEEEVSPEDLAMAYCRGGDGETQFALTSDNLEIWKARLKGLTPEGLLRGVKGECGEV